MTTETELRHLLEMAAKACGYMPNNNWRWSPRAGTDGAFSYRIGGDWVEWAPHTDDGDSARMRSALGIGVNFVCSPTSNRISGVRCFADRIGHYMQMHEHVERVAEHNNDRNAALRLCALKVAAMIGEGME